MAKKTTKNTASTISKYDWKAYYESKAVAEIPVYQAQGMKNKTSKNQFINICKLAHMSLKAFLISELTKYFDLKDIVSDDGFIFVPGSIPFAVTAHMDTVHRELIKDFYDYKNEKDEHILSSPQGIGGDDRCGIFMILKLLEAGFRPTVIFCEDEEIGCVGSKKFIKHDDLVKKLGECNYIIELDRKGSNDAVFYECDNAEFTNYIVCSTGYEEAWGSCSDISYLAPAAGIAAVNFSCGYYNPHQTSEYVNYTEMMNTVEVVKKLLEDSEAKQYEYIEMSYGYSSRYSSGYGYFGRYWDDYDNYYGNTYSEYYSKKTTKTKKKKDMYRIFAQFKNKIGGLDIDIDVVGDTLSEAVANMFIAASGHCLEELHYFEIMDDSYQLIDMDELLNNQLIDDLRVFGAECGNASVYY